MQLFKFLKNYLVIKMQLNFHFDKKNWLFSTQPAGSNEHETEWSQNSKIDNVKYFTTISPRKWTRVSRVSRACT
jgi:hypothetical protein